MALHEAIKFYNPTDEDFVGMWDSEPYDVKAKSTINLPSYIAEHFAKHLINKMLSEQINSLCTKHIKPDKNDLRTCKKCQEREKKLGNFYELPERDDLLKIMLPKDQVKSVEISSVE